jgi:ankyrin repeat protein
MSHQSRDSRSPWTSMLTSNHCTANRSKSSTSGADLLKFEKAASLCRNNKIEQLEDFFALEAFSIDERDEYGNALIHVGAQNGNKKIIKMLLRNGAFINAQNSNGQTPLHFCFAFGYKDLGEYLISKGADDSLCNKYGFTCYEGLGDRNASAL